MIPFNCDGFVLRKIGWDQELEESLESSHQISTINVDPLFAKRLRFEELYSEERRMTCETMARYELAAAERVRHPAVARIYAVGDDAERRLFVAREYVQGTPLDRIMKAEQEPDPRFSPARYSGRRLAPASAAQQHEHGAAGAEHQKLPRLGNEDGKALSVRERDREGSEYGQQVPQRIHPGRADQRHPAAGRAGGAHLRRRGREHVGQRNGHSRDHRRIGRGRLERRPTRLSVHGAASNFIGGAATLPPKPI